MCLAMVVGRSTGHAKSLGNSGSDGGQYEYMGDRIGALRALWYVDNIAVERFVICSLSMCFIFSFVFIRCAIWKRFNKNSPAAATTTTTTISAVQRRAGLPHTDTKCTHTGTPATTIRKINVYDRFMLLFLFFLSGQLCAAAAVEGLKGAKRGQRRGRLGVKALLNTLECCCFSLAHFAARFSLLLFLRFFFCHTLHKFIKLFIWLNCCCLV